MRRGGKEKRSTENPVSLSDTRMEVEYKKQKSHARKDTNFHARHEITL